MENKIVNLRNYAHLGDAVWELFVREKTIFMTNNVQNLHKITTSYVKTDFQYKLLQNIEQMLTQQELELAKRARNLPIPVGRKNIQAQYRQATAFEALVGWWYIHDKSRFDFIMEILEKFISSP